MDFTYEMLIQLLKKRGINSCVPSSFILKEDKPNVFIRHDAVESPYRLTKFMEIEYYNDMVSIGYLFWNSPLSTVYPLNLDIPLMQKAEKEFGFEYGINVWSPKPFNSALTLQLIKGQLGKLRHYFNISSWACYDVELKEEIKAIMRSVDIKNYFDILVNTNKMMGYVSDVPKAFDFLLKKPEMKPVIDALPTNIERIEYFIQNMENGSVYGIKTQTHLWSDELIFLV